MYLLVNYGCTRCIILLVFIRNPNSLYPSDAANTEYVMKMSKSNLKFYITYLEKTVHFYSLD